MLHNKGVLRNLKALAPGQRYCDSLGLKKLPSVQSLKQEYAALQTESGKIYPDLTQARTKMIELLTAFPKRRCNFHEMFYNGSKGREKGRAQP